MAHRRRAILETPNRKRRLRRRAIRIAILVAIFLCILCTGIIYFFRIPQLQISEVRVTGGHAIDPALLINEASRRSEGNIAGFIPRSFFLAYPRKEIATSILERYQEISFAEVKLSGFNKAEISITERSPYAFYCTASCYVADDKGLIYEEASTTPDQVIFRDFRPENQGRTLIGTIPLPFDTFKDLVSFIKRLTELKLHLKEVVIAEDGNVVVMVEEGKLLVSIQEPLGGQYEFLKTALSQELFFYPDGAIRSFNYIDLRFGKKVFYKL